MSQLVEEALWESLRSLPPNDAIVALVCTDIVGVNEQGQPTWNNILREGVTSSGGDCGDTSRESQ